MLARQKFANQSSEVTTSLSYSRNLGERGAMNVTATRSNQGGQVATASF